MQTILVTAGLACVIGAIIGGGLKAFQIDLPVIRSIARQVLLGTFGLALTTAGFAGWPTGAGTAADAPGTPGPSASRRTPRSPSFVLPTVLPTVVLPPSVSARGTVGPCRDLVVRVVSRDRSDGRLTLGLVVRNDNEQEIDLPPADSLVLVDEEGRQWQWSRFANAGGGWGLGPDVAPGAQVSVDVSFDAEGQAMKGSLTVQDVSTSNNPFLECAVKVPGVALRPS